MQFLEDEELDLDSGLVNQTGAPGLVDIQTASNRMTRQNYGFATTVALGAPLAAVDLVDTLASSIPGVSHLTGIKRGSINEAALRTLDMPGLSTFYEQNRGGIEATSGIAGIVASEVVARRFLGPGSRFMAGVSKLPYVGRIAALDAQHAAAMQVVRNTDRALASRGALGVEQYVGRAMVDDPITGTMRAVSRDSAVFKAKGLGALVGARHAAITEGVMAVTLNQNGFLYDDSAATNLMFAGLGLGLGAGLEWLSTAYQIRKFVNSDEIRRSFAGALDPELVEESRLGWLGRAKKQMAGGDNPDVGMFLGGRFSDQVTSYLVNASLLKETPTALDAEGRALLANREVLATQHLKLARETSQKITTKGISSQGRTRFSMDAPGYGNHLDMVMYRDAGSMVGVEQIGGIADDMTLRGVHDSHMARVEERLQETWKRIEELKETGEELEELEKLQGMVKRLKFEKNLNPMAIIDGEYMSLAEAEAFTGFVEPKDIKFTAAESRGKKAAFTKTQGEDRHGLWEAISENPKGNISLDSDFVYHLPGNKKLGNADLYDVMRLYKTGQRAIEQMVKFKGPIQLPNKPDWFQLDMAEEILRRNPDAQVMFPSGMNRETAQVESLVQKAEELRKLEAMGAAAKNRPDYETQVSKIRARFNLPRLSSYERAILGEVDHPVMNLLRGIHLYGADEIRKMGLQELREAAAQFKRLGDIGPVTSNDMDLFGSSFRMGVDESGKAIKPLLVYKRALDAKEWTQDMVAERLAAANLNAVKALVDDKAAPMSRSITTSVLSSPDFELASRTHELMDNQIQGSLAGKAPQNFFSTVQNAFSTSEWRDRDNPIMLAATRIRELINRQTRDFMKVTFERAFGDTLGQLDNPRNTGSRLLLDQFHSHAGGWDLKANPLKRDGGFNAFILADTKENRDRFKLLHGRDMVEGQTLLSPSGKEIVLDDLSLAAQQQFNAVTEILAQEKNTLLRSQGRGEIEVRRWYVPSPKTDGKYIGFTIGADGKTVPDMTVVESTPEAFRQARAKVEEKINKMGLGYTFKTQEEIKDFATIWDKAQMDFMDPGTTAIQPSKRGRGALQGQEIRVNAWAESLQHVRDQYLNHGDDLTETLFKNAINSAKARATIASEATQNKGRLEQNRSIYDMYLENLFGTSKLSHAKSLVGGHYNKIEGTIDSFLNTAAPSTSRVWHATTEWINKKIPWSKSQQARKDFDALTKALGPYMPFESANQMLERQGAGAAPLTLAKITGEVNRFSAGILLRMFEVAHPIMNLSGIINAMPSVIRHATPRDGEDAAALAARIGHNSQIFNLGDGRAIGVIDMSKIGGRAFKRAWSKTSHADYDFMVRNGYLTQEVAEFHRQFGSIESKGAWERFMYGDPNRKGFQRKGIIGWTDILSSRSEDFSRSWGHMVGLEVAEVVGIKGREAKHAFAHDIANKMIANYSPQNRPEVFQGAVGAPIGLFQSFIQNYYQRLFRYVETKDYRSLATQYAMQAGLFGVTGVPGFQAFQAFWTGQTDGESDPASAIHQRFGGAGDMLASGVLSNLPTLFGLDSANLYSRGDTSIRQFGMDLSKPAGEIASSMIPALNVLGSLAAGVSAGFATFSAEHPELTLAQLSEVASNAIANRPLAGMIEQALNGGRDVDRYGQVVSETKSWAETAYRLMGIRSMRQSREIEAFYADKTRQEYQNAAMSELRLKTRTAMRKGVIDDVLPKIFEEYLEKGGNRRYFRRWIKENYEAATDTRAERRLESLLKNPDKMGDALRYLDSGVSITEAEQTEQSVGYGPDAEDELNQDTMELGNYSGQITTEENPDQP